MSASGPSNMPRPAQRSVIPVGKRVVGIPNDDDDEDYETMDEPIAAQYADRQCGNGLFQRSHNGDNASLYDDEEDEMTKADVEMFVTPQGMRSRGGAAPFSKRVSTEDIYTNATSLGKNEWNPSASSDKGENFALGVEVFVPLRSHVFANLLMIFTVFLAIAVIVRGLVSLIASVTEVDINMEHLHIADTVIFVFGVFMLGSGVSFFYIQDYMETTYRHKVTVLKPYMVAVLFSGISVISMWTFTRDHGAHLDRDDFVQLTKYTTTHIFHTISGFITLITIPDALYAHSHPESESPHKYSIIPRPGFY